MNITGIVRGKMEENQWQYQKEDIPVHEPENGVPMIF